MKLINIEMYLYLLCKQIKLFWKLTFFLLLTRILYSFIRKFVQKYCRKVSFKITFFFTTYHSPLLFVEFPFFPCFEPLKKYHLTLRIQMANIAMMFPCEYTNVESINTMLSTKIFTLLSFVFIFWKIRGTKERRSCTKIEKMLI